MPVAPPVREEAFAATPIVKGSSMAFRTIFYDVQDGIAEIRLNRPHRLNAVVQELYSELAEALSLAETMRDARVVLLTGEGRAFCVGADLKEHKAGRTAFEPACGSTSAPSVSWMLMRPVSSWQGIAA